MWVQSQMFYKSYEKSEARAFDHLYDPLYVSGHVRDIQRQNRSALVKTAPINIFTNYGSMFSDSSHRPRQFSVLQQNKLPKSPVPNSLYIITMNHIWITNYLFLFRDVELQYSTVARSFFVSLVNNRCFVCFFSHFLPEPSDINKIEYSRSAVERNRVKFFTSSFIKGKNAKITHIHLMRNSDQKSDQKPQIKLRTIGMQTQYREQSAQTKPYFPDIHYHSESDRQFKLFQSSNNIDLDLGNDRIENIKKRLECKQNLKHCSEVIGNVEKVFDWQEWLLREHDFDEMQAIRMKFVEDMLYKREKLFEKDSSETINRSIVQFGRERQAKIAKIK